MYVHLVLVPIQGWVYLHAHIIKCQENDKLKVCENKVLRKMFGTCRYSVSAQFTIIQYE